MEYNNILDIDPYDYEEYVAEYLRNKGYKKVTTTNKSGDYGADVLAVAPNGVKVCVQCKRYKGSVGVKAVQEVYSAKKYYDCDLACVFTTGEYSRQAYEYAEKTGVKLYHYIPNYNGPLPKKTIERSMRRENYSTSTSGGRRAAKRTKISPITGIIAILIVLAVIGRCGKSSNTNQTIEAEKVAEIASQPWHTALLQEFDYKYENQGITLHKYKGSAPSVIIPAYYEVENTELPVLKLDGTFNRNKSIINIAVSEGINKITSDTLYDCYNLKHLFIPSSVEYIGSLLQTIDNNGEILFFGGSEEQWDNTKNYRPIRSKISFKTVRLNATIEECMENKETTIETKEPVVQGYAPLSSFSYDTRSGGYIILKKYQGKSQTVRIQPSYIVDGVERMVVELDGTFNGCDKVLTVVIPEGIKKLEQSTFNGCKASRIYLPASLEDVPQKLWGYFHGTDTVYYGGSEEQFAKLTNMSRWDIDIKNMVYNATPDDVG